MDVLKICDIFIGVLIVTPEVWTGILIVATAVILFMIPKKIEVGLALHSAHLFLIAVAWSAFAGFLITYAAFTKNWAGETFLAISCSILIIFLLATRAYSLVAKQEKKIFRYEKAVQ